MVKPALMIVLLAGFLFLPACVSRTEVAPTASEVFVGDPTPTQAPTYQPPGEPTALISEVLSGVEGNNNFDFIELYNPSVEMPLNLKGWSLWFKLADEDADKLVYAWTESSLVPPQGHYLLVYEGQEVGLPADAHMGTAMIPQRGALQLRQGDNTVADSLSWGGGPAGFAEGNPAPGLKTGLALERGPGGSKGNWMDTQDNATDFTFSTPNPQNTGSSPAPAQAGRLVLSLSAPDSVLPGSEFTYQVSVGNQSGQDLHEVTAQIPLAGDLEIVQVPAEIKVLDKAKFWDLEEVHQVALWEIGSLEAGETVSATITVGTPWTYLQVVAANYSVQAGDWLSPVFGSPVTTAVAGGAIPVGVLADLVGETLTIEGTASMYTGGYYAGGGNVKFYLEDESGGVQVWVPGGEGQVEIDIGDQVQVAGELEIYRGALELVVNDPGEVKVIRQAEGNPQPLPTSASIAEASNDPHLAGKLVQVEGMVARNEEYAYSYELDLIDESGQLITLYVDKLTNINVETIESGQSYRVTGILEIYDTRQQLYPRIQEDLERVYPPVLSLEMAAPNTIASGEPVQITLTAVNYTPDPLTGVVITATLPAEHARFVAASEGAEIRGSNLLWNIPELAGEGARVSVHYTVQALPGGEYLVFKGYQAAAKEWSDPVGGDPFYIFIGDTVPIWAIQGSGSRSPYTFSTVLTAGTVTGVTPELGGFWIQESASDNDPLTSAGIFIYTGEQALQVDPANIVQVRGVVRETYQETRVQITDPQDIQVLAAGSSLPASVELDPPPGEIDANTYFESLEGMLVQVSEAAVAVGPTSPYGEYVLVLSKHGVARLWQGEMAQNGLAIMVDDGSSKVHADGSTLPYAVNVGDQVSGLIGPLAYSYGRYKIEPVAQPQVIAREVALPSLEPPGPGAFSIMTWNVENLFDVLDPHPSDPPKPGIRAYKGAIAKVANTILAAGTPTIVGLQEVENIGILEDIAAHEVLAGFEYQPFLIEGTDSRYIDNGYLVRGEVARVLAVQQQVAPQGLTSRPPLQIEVEISTPAGPLRLVVLNNHFTSMSGGETATEPRRAAQAAWNVTVLEGITSTNPEAYAAVIGDLNAYYDSSPLDVLRQAGLMHVFEMDSQAGWYSYIYQGASQTLDHILVTPALYDLLKQVEVLHVNADYALPLAEDESPLGKSDHDPVIAVFTLPE